MCSGDDTLAGEPENDGGHDHAPEHGPSCKCPCHGSKLLIACPRPVLVADGADSVPRACYRNRSPEAPIFEIFLPPKLSD